VESCRGGHGIWIAIEREGSRPLRRVARWVLSSGAMRTLSIAVSILGLVFVAGCVVESAPQKTVRRGGSSKVGKDNQNGEHGDNEPAGPDDVPDPGKSVGSETWADGKTIDSNITIRAGAVVEIEPGATINVADDVAITVEGTLRVASTDMHAKLTGTRWTGLVIASGGTLDADGLDIENASAALWTRTGNLDAKLTNGNIVAQSPFKMEAGSKLSIVKTNVKASAGSAIAGTFTASYMVYDKGTAGGLTLNDPAGTMTISDSELKGNGGGDFVISSAGKELKLEYTTISGSHCAIHFTGIDKFTIDHVSADQNSWGAMLYGSGPGPHTITSSNIRNTDTDLDVQGTNGPITVSNTLSTKNKGLSSDAIKNPATEPIPNARPRPQG